MDGALVVTAVAAPSGLPVSVLKRMADDAVDLTSAARDSAEKARDYYDGYQLAAAEEAALKRRKQPPVVINRIRRKIDAMIGLEQKGRVDPRALPRTPDDEQAADLATKALVFCDDITRLDAKRSAFAYNLAIEGFGGVEVVVRENKGALDPDVVRLRWEEIFYDPHSRELDFSDASFMGVQKWMDMEAALEFCRRFVPEMDDQALSGLLETSMSIVDGGTYDDRPRGSTRTWGDKRKGRVRLAYMYYRHRGEWWLALFGGSGTIYNEPSPYLDENGKPDNAMILQACYVDRENRRYGIVRDMMSAQDEVNKRRSKLLHMLNSRQTMGQRGASAMTTAEIKREMALPDGHIEYEQDPSSAVPSFQIVPQTDQVMGQFQLLQESKSEIDMLGPNASLLGQLSGQQSGRAIFAQQQAGYAELAPYYDGIREWTIRVYRALWNRIRQFWTEPRWIRISDEPEGPQFIGLNMPQVNEFGQVDVTNQVAQLDIDIIVDMTPEYASLQQEEFEQLSQLAQSGMPIPPDVLIEASTLRNKAKLLEMLKAQREDPMAAQQAQMMAERAMAETAEKQAATMQKQADAAKKQAETQEILSDIGASQERVGLEQARTAAEVRAKGARAFKDETHAARTQLAMMPPLPPYGLG